MLKSPLSLNISDYFFSVIFFLKNQQKEKNRFLVCVVAGQEEKRAPSLKMWEKNPKQTTVIGVIFAADVTVCGKI